MSERTTPAESRTAENVEFPCDNCGAEMKWDPAADALTCEYCERVEEVSDDEGVIVERSLEEAGQAVRGLGLEVRVAKCSN